MPISRLENFLRSPKGTVIYVDPNSFDATDSFENRGDSATRPFKTIQRALIEASRFSYQLGFNNDLNDRTTILVSSGTHYIDNRPGLSITNSSGSAVYKKRTGFLTWETETLNEFTENSNFDIFDANNDLYKFNSIEGGVILPRGTSIVGLDLRKTKIRPLYIPDPLEENVERTSIFKVTGNCYFTSFTFFDADLATGAYKDYTNNLVVPKFSHHKLTAFTYADGVNKVKLGLQQTDLTDLEMYYYKIANAYGITSGRDIPNYPSNTEIEPIIDEYRIVGILEENLIGISSIRSGDGTGGGLLNEITVTTKNLASNLESPHNLSENTPILISGVSVSASSYNGSFTVNSVVGPNTFTYITPSIPSNKLPSSGQINSALIKVESDNTSSSSPYVFNCSLRSSYGMCGLWADGNKADGFKSIVVAQFTGISLQKDDNAFLIYSKSSKNYIKQNQLSQSSVERPLHTNSSAIYDPEYENFHIRASNNSFIQCVSIFAIGFANHFVTETGGDMSITNSNSNFGALSLKSSGFRNKSFDRDDVGYITHIIPPRDIPKSEIEVNWLPIDVGLTTSNSNDNDKFLYLFGYDDINIVPPYKIDGYRIGAKQNETLNIILDDTSTVYKSPIYMQPNSGSPSDSSKKEYQIERINGVNSISSNSQVITFTENHNLITGEKVRLFSDTGQMPDGLESNVIYYVIRTSNNTIKLAYNYNDAIAEVNITGISNNGGVISVISSVSDKFPGEEGHPIQWDSVNNNWYIISSDSSDTNKIRQRINQLGSSILGDSTPETSFTRFIDTRSIEDRLYKVRYVIPKNYSNIREPEIGFVLQETKSVGVTAGSINSNVDLQVSDQRNERIISAISAGAITNNSQLVTAKTELPHKFSKGDIALIQNVKSTFNTSASGITSTFNGSYEVLDIPDSRTFTYRISGVSTNPGVFTNNLQTRTTNTISSLPIVSREQYKNTFIVYRVETIKNHIPGPNGQDGVYHLTLISSNVDTISNLGYGLSTRSYNQDVRNLYPQIDRDNFVSNPKAAISYADHLVQGKVITNNKSNSLTREALGYFIQNNNLGFGITGITLSGIGNTTITLQTEVEHKLNSIKTLSITNSGNEPDGTYYGSQITISGTPTDAKCNYTITGGAIQSITIIDGGSAFTPGTTVGIGTSNGTAEVDEIISNISDGLQLEGFNQEELNDVFKIINIPNSKQIVLESTTQLPLYSENTNGRVPFGMLSSKGVGITSFKFSDISSGIVTVTSISPHGLKEGNNFKVIGSGSSIYDSNFIVNSILNPTEFTFNIGIATTNPSSSKGTLFRKVLHPNFKSTGRTGENLQSRINYIYSGISTTEINATNKDSTVLQFSNSQLNGFKRGDYIQINEEILRLIQEVNIDQFNVERGMFGTIKKDIPANSRVNKIKIIPVELRRPSFIRASGHTFEYLGYGPGNYSTSIPQKQSRKLSEDEIIVSQSRKLSGGTVVYSGMNDIGEFYNGAKKVSAITGQEVVVEAPILSFTGDDVDGSDDPSKVAGIFDNLLIRQKLTVEGGENGTDTSVFYGGVKFLGNTSFEKGLNLKNLKLNNKGFRVNDKSSNLLPLSLGDISYAGYSTSFIGEIYTSSSWRRWGLISRSPNSWDIGVDKLTATDIEVTDSLTIDGVKFGKNNVIDDLKVNSLEVTGNTILKGGIYGSNATSIVQFRDTIGVSNDLSVGITTSYLRGSGRILDIAATPTSDYSFRIIREISSGFTTNTNTRMFHSGDGILEIKSLNNAASIILNNSDQSNLSLLSSTNGGIVQVSKTNTGNGSAGAHLSILNNNSAGDAVLSWRSGNNPFWMAGVDSNNGSGNKWKLALSGGTSVLPTFSSTSFQDSNTAIGIRTDRSIELYNGNLRLVGVSTLSLYSDLTISNLSPKISVEDSNTGISYSLLNNNGDLTLDTTRLITPNVVPTTTNIVKIFQDTISKVVNRIAIASTICPIIIGSETPTGTTNQLLQIRNGAGAYIAGNLGVGVLSPTEKLSVSGDVRISGIITGSAIRTSENKIQESALDTKIPTEKAVVEYLNTNYAKAPKTGSFIILHVASSPGSALTGYNSVPDGYSPEGVSFTSYIPGSENLRNTIFTSVTEALREASNRYVPLGSEIIVSVHNNITTQEEGPLMISNSWTPVVVAAARGASSGIGITMTVGGTNSMITADTRFTQFDFPIISSGIIFQDINVNVGIGATSVSGVVLTFNGGFGVSGRDMNINWYNCRNNNKLINATASYGEKIQFRVSIPLKDGPGKNYDIRTACYPAPTSSGVGNTSTHMSMIDQVGGLAGQGVDLIFDFKQAGYGDPIEDNNTLRFSFVHGFSSAVKLTMVGIGGRGNCTIASRIVPKVKWNFNNNNWDMSAFYNGFHERPNVCAEAFSILEPPTGTTVSQFYNISFTTAESMRVNPIRLKYGAKIWAKDYNSGPFNLYTYLNNKPYSNTNFGNIIGLADSDLFDAQLYN